MNFNGLELLDKPKGGKMEPQCSECEKLQMEKGEVPPNWAVNRFYTCSEGRYAIGKTYKRWFAWSGIIHPNKTVATAQKDCPIFSQRW